MLQVSIYCIYVVTDLIPPNTAKKKKIQHQSGHCNVAVNADKEQRERFWPNQLKKKKKAGNAKKTLVHKLAHGVLKILACSQDATVTQ